MPNKNKTFFEILFIFFYVLLFGFLFRDTIHLENIDYDIYSKISNKNIPKGSVYYDPQYNLIYFLYFIVENIKIELSVLIKFLWFIEKILLIFSISLICKLILKTDTIFITILLLLPFLRSGEFDQKTFCLSLQLLSIFYFLNKKFILSSFFLSLVFYIHVGMGVWWFLPSIFAFLYLILKKVEGYSLIKFLNYLFFVSIFITPLLYIYFFYIDIYSTINTPQVLEFWLGINNSFYYYILNKNINDVFFIIANFIFFIFSIYILKNQIKCNLNILISIPIGTLVIFFLNEIVILYNQNTILLKLQILRAHSILFYFNLIFISLILFNQMKRKNYIFFIIFILLLIPNPVYLIFRYISFYETLYIFWFSILLYEHNHKNFIYNKFLLYLNFLFDRISLFNKTYPFFVLLILIFAISNQIFSFEKLYKTIIKKESFIVESKYNQNKLINFINNINDDKILIIFPFVKEDFKYLIDKKSLVSINDIFDYVPANANFMVQFFNDEFSFGKKEILIEKYNVIEAWKNLNSDNFTHWKKKYGITHIVRETNLPLNFKKIFSDNKYDIYVFE